jgi:transcriptional regulator with XRE-family HTH domain
MNPITEEILMHYGMPRRSGRYPWGSGDDPYQRSMDFIGRVEELKKQGWQETKENIMDEFGLFTNEYRIEKAWAKAERRIRNVETAKRLRDKEGLNTSEIGRKMNVNESTVREWFDEEKSARMYQARNTADFLKAQVKEKKMIDVGAKTEKDIDLGYKIGVSREKLNEALYILEQQGYVIHKGGIPQINTKGQQTNQWVLCEPGTPASAIYDYDKVKTIADYRSHDGGETFKPTFVYPKSMDSKRLMIRYAEDGGIDKDGVIELRRGVDDLSLGESRYSQVRILVDNDRYLKGMALYSDNMPDGVDVIFNTNKTKDMPMRDVLKKIKKDDPENPFGSLIKEDGGQSYYIDKDGKEQLSLINKRADEGDWTEWKDKLPSQFLGKQSIYMINKQLNLAKADKMDEYNDICSLENPTLKKHFLKKFADECDSAAVHLQAAALPGQKYHVIVPVSTLTDKQIYAPQYPEGSEVALVRYPHGGTFEIPRLTVTHKNKLAKELIGADSIDAVCINKKIADRLSGADFDGDTVMVIPTHDPDGKVKVTSRDPLKGLEGFDPKINYGYDDFKEDPDGTVHYYRQGSEFKVMRNTQGEMGAISNLITDMTLAGATDDKLAAAVRHSMVVIDAEKHKLDYKRSEIDNNIAALKKEYQKKKDGSSGGASTILSLAKGEVSVERKQGTAKVNLKDKPWYDPSKPEGSLLYKKSDDLWFPVKKFNKSTGDYTITTVDGKKISYNVNDKEAFDYYNPVRKINGKEVAKVQGRVMYKETDADGKVTYSPVERDKLGNITGTTTYTNKDGTITYKLDWQKQQSTRMAEAQDANELVSVRRDVKELAYANYANDMKALANKSRVEVANTERIKVDSSAKKTYADEVAELERKLDIAERNAVRERSALRKANSEIAELKKANPNMSKDDLKKMSSRIHKKYRVEDGTVSRKERNIEITDREWEAIQAGAISEDKLSRILNNTDTDALRQRAMPKNTTTVSPTKLNRIKALSASGYSLSYIAEACGVSPSVVSKYVKGKKE